MQQIIHFLIRNKTFLLYVFLLLIAFLLTLNSHSYHKSKTVNSANFVTGSIYSLGHNISGYFGLKGKNKALAEENKRLNELLYSTRPTNLASAVDSLNSPNFRFITAEVIKNSYSSPNNILLVNRGSRHGIKTDFGVVGPLGLIGIVDNTSYGYASVLSILNTSSKIHAQLKKSNHFGTLQWNGLDYRKAQLIDLPKTAPVKTGDTVITGGRSLIFPKGVPVGTIESFTLDNSQDFYMAHIKLFTDMTNLGTVYLVENLDYDEILKLDQLHD